LGVPDLLPVGLRSVLASSQAFDSFRGFSSVCLSSAGPPDFVTAKDHFSCQVDSGGTTGRNRPTRIVRRRFPDVLRHAVCAVRSSRTGKSTVRCERVIRLTTLVWPSVMLAASFPLSR